MFYSSRLACQWTVERDIHFRKIRNNYITSWRVNMKTPRDQCPSDACRAGSRGISRLGEYRFPSWFAGGSTVWPAM